MSCERFFFCNISLGSTGISFRYSKKNIKDRKYIIENIIIIPAIIYRHYPLYVVLLLTDVSRRIILGVGSLYDSGPYDTSLLNYLVISHTVWQVTSEYFFCHLPFFFLITGGLLLVIVIKAPFPTVYRCSFFLSLCNRLVPRSWHSHPKKIR